MLKDRLWAMLGLSVGTLYIAGPSQVPLNLWVVAGAWADVVVYSWMTTLVVLTIYPGKVQVHYAAAFLAILVFGGRGGGFLSLVIHEHRPDLYTAVGERLFLAGTAALWHWRAIKMLDMRRLVQLYEEHLRALSAVEVADDRH